MRYSTANGWSRLHDLHIGEHTRLIVRVDGVEERARVLMEASQGTTPDPFVGRADVEHLRDVLVRRPKRVGNGLSDLAEPFLALPQGLLGPLELGGIDRNAANQRVLPPFVGDGELADHKVAGAAAVLDQVLTLERLPGGQDRAVLGPRALRRLGSEEVARRPVQNSGNRLAQDFGHHRVHEDEATFLVADEGAAREMLHERVEAPLTLDKRYPRQPLATEQRRTDGADRHHREEDRGAHVEFVR